MDFEILKSGQSSGISPLDVNGLCAGNLVCVDPDGICPDGVCPEIDLYCPDPEPEPEPEPNGNCTPNIACRYTCGGGNGNCGIEMSV